MIYDTTTVYAPSLNGTGPVRKIADVDSSAITASLQQYIDKMSRDLTRIGLRTAKGFDGAHRFRTAEGNPNNLTFEDFTDWMPGTEMVQEVATSLGIRPAGRVRLLLIPGNFGLPHLHNDPDLWRVHIPLITNPKAYIFIENKVWHLPPDAAYLISVEHDHAPFNLGDQDRIHMVFDRCANLA